MKQEKYNKLSEIFRFKRNNELIYIKSRLLYPGLFSRQNMTRPAQFPAENMAGSHTL